MVHRNNKLIQFLLVTIIMIAAIPFYAQNKLSLSKAINIGLSNNFGIKILKIEENIAQLNLDNINKERLPKINLLAEQQNGFNNNNTPTSFVQEFYSDRGLNLRVDANWIIFEGFKARIDKSRLEKLHNLSKGNSMLLVENTIHAIMLAYYNAYVQSKAVKVREDAKNRSRERYQDIKFQFKHGKVSTYEVLRFENALLIDSSNIILQTRDLKLAMQALNTAMGNKIFRNYTITDEIKFQKENYNFDKLQQKMASLNRELVNQYINLTLRKNDIGLMRASRKPTVAINGGLNQRFNATKFLEMPKIRGNSFQFYLNFSVSYNLFDGGEVDRSIQKAKLWQEVETLKIENIKQELSAELQNVITNYETQLQIIKINESIAKNLKRNMILEEDRYKNGFSSLLDYRSLQQEYLNVEQTRLEAIYQLLVSETEILKLTGGLTKYNG